ncbi:hypothetical protein [Streptomyces sp. NPDC051546]|uniref:hypothetical protein n=1 Tax=Streptomyces sp. NPDC051546 TaxID=3365655 RepID=UPI003796E954
MTLSQVPEGGCCGRLWTLMVLVMQTGTPFWDPLVFDGIGEVDVGAVAAASAGGPGVRDRFS